MGNALSKLFARLTQRWKIDTSDKGIALKIVPINVTMRAMQYKEEPMDGPTIRSCWECNPAHERLKACEHLVCFVCGRSFKLGVEQK